MGIESTLKQGSFSQVALSPCLSNLHTLNEVSKKINNFVLTHFIFKYCKFQILELPFILKTRSKCVYDVTVLNITNDTITLKRLC